MGWDGSAPLMTSL